MKKHHLKRNRASPGASSEACDTQTQTDAPVDATASEEDDGDDPRVEPHQVGKRRVIQRRKKTRYGVALPEMCLLADHQIEEKVPEVFTAKATHT